jgi:translation initiation factor 2B subunit (eIF-2B alpha/beta/delta family)
MHPIEHLRYVARARGADPALLVRETAEAMMAMRIDASGIMIACRRIVERQADCGPLWWFASKVVTSIEPAETAWELAAAIEHDATPRQLAEAIAQDATVVVVGDGDLVAEGLSRRGDVQVYVVDSRHRATSVVRQLERAEVPCDPVQPEALAAVIAAADLVLVECVAMSPERGLVPVGGLAAALVAADVGVPIWMVGGVGRRLPEEYVAAIETRLGEAVDPVDGEYESVRVDLLAAVVTEHGSGAPSVMGRPDCPFAPELLRVSPI